MVLPRHARKRTSPGFICPFFIALAGPSPARRHMVLEPWNVLGGYNAAMTKTVSPEMCLPDASTQPVMSGSVHGQAHLLRKRCPLGEAHTYELLFQYHSQSVVAGAQRLPPGVCASCDDRFNTLRVHDELSDIGKSLLTHHIRSLAGQHAWGHTKLHLSLPGSTSPG